MAVKMKPKTQIRKLTAQMNLGQLSIGQALIAMVRIGREHNSEFSDEFLNAVEKEGKRLLKSYVEKEFDPNQFKTNPFMEKEGD